MYLSKLQLETLFSLAAMLQVGNNENMLLVDNDAVAACVLFFPFDEKKRAVYNWDMAGQCWKLVL